MRFPITSLLIIIIQNPNQEAGHELRANQSPPEGSHRDPVVEKGGASVPPKPQGT